MLEVLIVVTIMAIMMGFGIPYILGWMPNYRARNAARDVHSNLQSARMTAIKEHRACTVTFGANGYTIYFDDPDNHDYVFDKDDTNDQLLKEVNIAEEFKNDVVYGGTTLPDNSVTFLSNGLIEALLGNASRTISITTADGSRNWVITVSPSGGVRTTLP
jgi:Tfp pilus assembly protein FimT